MIARVCAAIVVLCVACDSPHGAVDAAAPAPVVTPAPVVDAGIVDAAEEVSADAIFERSLHMLEEVATIVQENASDCDVLAQRLLDYYHRNAAAIAVGHETYDELGDEARSAVQAKYRARYHAAWDRLKPGAKKCKDDAKVTAAADRLFGHYHPDLPMPGASSEP